MSNQEEIDQKFMRLALIEANRAYKIGEVPVGAVLVHKGSVIAKAHNQVEMLKDATAHAEMVAITMGEEALSNWRLLDVTLYTTLEPCIMCAGAAFAARVKRIVWGARDIRLGANGSFVDLFDKKHPIHQCDITGHILEGESADLLRRFFQKRRKEKSCLEGILDEAEAPTSTR